MLHVKDYMVVGSVNQPCETWRLVHTTESIQQSVVRPLLSRCLLSDLSLLSSLVSLQLNHKIS